MNVIAKKLKGCKTLVYLLAGVFALWAEAAWAADWTDASGNEYTALKYIKGNGKRAEGGPWMVLTNITAQCTDTVKMKFKLADTSTQGLWCSRKTSSSNFSAFYSVSSNKKISFYRKTGTAVAHTKELNIDDECTVIADYNARSFTVNGETETLSSLDSGSYDVGPIMLFGTYNAGTTAAYNTYANGNRGSYYLYYFQIYSSTGTLRHNLLPATNMTAQTVGLFDTVTRTFYTPDYSTRDFKFTTAEYDNYTWGGGAAANWWASDVWSRDNVASSWIEYNNAIFNTANATVTLDNDVLAGKVAFNADATIVTNGTDASTLTVPTVSVAQNVIATIAAPTVGALEKTGAGTLVLTQNRTNATTVAEGALKMDGATVSDLTLGTNGGAPLVFDYGGQSLQKDPADFLVTGSDVTLTNGTFTMSGGMSIRDNTKIPAVLTIAKDATLNTESWLTLDKDNGAATVNVVGGAFGKTFGTDASYLQHASLSGQLNINVTDGGLLTYSGNLYALCSGNNGATPTLCMMFSGSSFYVGDTFYFGATGKVSTEPIGVFAATNSTITVATTFNIGRNAQDEKMDGSFTADFERCTITAKTFAVYHDRPLNNTRFNDTRFVFNAASGSIAASDGEANWITVGDNGLIIDTQGYSATLNANLGGFGAVTKTGMGTLNVSRDQTTTGGFNVSEGTLALNAGLTVNRPIAVVSGATLSVNAANTTSVSGLSLAADSTLNITSYNCTAPLAVSSLSLPESGTVNLTLSGGAFTRGVYAIYSKSGVTAADGAKFTPSTGDLDFSWSVSGDKLVLTVGAVSGNYWTGLGGDGRMSTAANWLNGVPAAGADIDFSGIPNNTTIIADADRTFRNVTLGSSVITFTNAMAAASYTDTSNVVVAADSTVTVKGDLVFYGSEAEYIVNSVAAGGTFRVTGRIVADSSKTGNLYPCVSGSIAGTIEANGLVHNGNGGDFWLARNQNGSHVSWAIGAYGISGTELMGYTSNANINYFSASITATADFTVTTPIVNRRTLTLNPAGHVITLGTNTAISAGAIIGGSYASNVIAGPGKVVATYTIGTYSKNNPFTIETGATLELIPGVDLGTGLVTVQNGGTLEVAESGTVTLNGGLNLADGANLAFNFTDRRVAPQIAVAQGMTVTVSGAVKVKVSGDVWPTAGEKELTACGGFDAEGVIVTLADGAPKWAKDVGVNEDGNIVLTVKPKPMILIVR